MNQEILSVLVEEGGFFKFEFSGRANQSPPLTVFLSFSNNLLGFHIGIVYSSRIYIKLIDFPENF